MIWGYPYFRKPPYVYTSALMVLPMKNSYRQNSEMCHLPRCVLPVVTHTLWVNMQLGQCLGWRFVVSPGHLDHVGPSIPMLPLDHPECTKCRKGGHPVTRRAHQQAQLHRSWRLRSSKIIPKTMVNSQGLSSGSHSSSSQFVWAAFWIAGSKRKSRSSDFLSHWGIPPKLYHPF